MKVFLISLLVLYSFKNFAQVQTKDSLQLFGTNDLIFDFNYLKLAIFKMHPSLNRYTKPDSLVKYFDITRAKLNKRMTELDFWLKLQHLVASIRSGHTQLDLSKKFNSSYKKQSHYILPFTVFIRADRIFIKTLINSNEASVHVNDEVISINGETAKQLLNHLRGLISGDGYNITWKDYVLGKGKFNKLFELTHSHDSVCKIGILNYLGQSVMDIKLIKAKVSSSSGENLPTENKIPFGQYDYNAEFDEGESRPVLSFNPELKNTAILKIPSFNYDDFRKVNSDFFTILKKKKIVNLIIDLRNNEGGADFVCIDLLKYLINKPFQFCRNDESVVDTSTILNLSAKENISLNEIANVLNVPRLSFVPPADEQQPPYPNRFVGSVILMVNGGTFSAATLFAVALKTQAPCKIVGLETGGARAGCDGGTMMHLTLPKTGLQLHLPLLWTNSMMDEVSNGKGLRPDYLIVPSAWDFSYGDLKKYLQ